MNPSSGLSSALIESVFNHVALPPQLPGKYDRAIEETEGALLDYLLAACRTARELTSNRLAGQWHWDCIYRSLQTCKMINIGGKINKAILLNECQSLGRKEVLLLHVTKQIAGLLVRRYLDEHNETVIFEGFEASASSKEVLASERALRWDFPGGAVAIPYATFIDTSFQEGHTTFLEQASTESIKYFSARAGKAGSLVFECRDTTDPSLVTKILLTLLEANGSRSFPPILRKEYVMMYFGRKERKNLGEGVPSGFFYVLEFIAFVYSSWWGHWTRIL